MEEKKAITHEDIIEKRRELLGSDFVAYQVLSELLPHDGSWRSISLENVICLTAYTDKQTLLYAINRLVNSGHIEKVRGNGCPNSYRLVF